MISSVQFLFELTSRNKETLAENLSNSSVLSLIDVLTSTLLRDKTVPKQSAKIQCKNFPVENIFFVELGIEGKVS